MSIVWSGFSGWLFSCFLYIPCLTRACSVGRPGEQLVQGLEGPLSRHQSEGGDGGGRVYDCWTIKKAECQRTDGCELQCWRRLLRVPWTVRRSNQSTLKEFNPEYSLEGLMLKLKRQSFGHLMRRDPFPGSLEKTLMLGKI